MGGYIRLEFGTNACGITAFASYVSTTVFNSNSPVSAPSPKPVVASPATFAPTKKPIASWTKAKYHRDDRVEKGEALVPAPAPSLSRAIVRDSALAHTYTYLYHYIPPSLQVGYSPVAYYSSAVQQYYSPKPTVTAHAFPYYGSPRPTLTHTPTSKLWGQFGYSNAATPTPSKMPLAYYYDFYKVHPPFPKGEVLQLYLSFYG